MGASVVVTRTFGDLAKFELLTRDDMKEIGLLVREQIVRRTVRGIDADGKAFAPYSPGYAKAKQTALGGTTVNLQVSGNMLNDLQVTEARGWTDEDGPSVTLGWNL